MPAVAVTAVSTSLDTLTATAHGLVTGDRFRLRNVGGALPAATPSLAGVTDYFAVRVDANNIKVATSSANALAGTPVVVDITGSGSGTTTIEYGLPYTIPNAVYVNGVSQVQDKDLNTTFNALVAFYDLLTGQSQSLLSGPTFAGSVAVGGDLTVSGVFHGPTKYDVINPTLASGNNNDFAPTGIAAAVAVMCGATATATITGMAGGVNGRVVHLVNTSGFNVSITNNDSNSIAANRFFTPGAATATMAGSSNHGTTWIYDGATPCWRMLAKTF